MSALQLAGIRDLAERFDVFILDQFGVLHDGVAPYSGAVETLVRLQELGKRTLLLSNSGKRSAPNEAQCRPTPTARPAPLHGAGGAGPC